MEYQKSAQYCKDLSKIDFSELRLELEKSIATLILERRKKKCAEKLEKKKTLKNGKQE